MSDIDTAVVDSLKVLDPNRPIREAGIRSQKKVLLGPINALFSADIRWGEGR